MKLRLAACNPDLGHFHYSWVPLYVLIKGHHKYIVYMQSTLSIGGVVSVYSRLMWSVFHGELMTG